jgi:hypothetical protein
VAFARSINGGALQLYVADIPATGFINMNPPPAAR